jgi:hypothetical protein
MVVVPDPTPWATPIELTVATAWSVESQFTWRVMSNAEPSLKLPVAVNDCVDPGVIDALDGVRVMETRVALVTVRVALPTCPEKTAEMVVVPGCTPVAKPAVLAALLTVAAFELEDVQLANAVKFCISPFVNVPMAENGVEKPTGTLFASGLTEIEPKAADSTNTLAAPEIAPSVAVIVTTPADCPDTSPFWLTLATLLPEETQVHKGLIHSTVPSVKFPYAAIPTEDPGASCAVDGVMVIDESVAVLTVRGVDPTALAPA